MKGGKMKCLITGDQGFVGRHFTKRLRSMGHTVYGVDTADPKDPQDCRDIFRLNKYNNVDLVVHCAATIPDLETRTLTPMAVAEDLALDAEMFQWALRTQPGRVVYFSSSAAYPQHLQMGDPWFLAENDLDLDVFTTPDAMYGLTKLVGEIQAQEARKQGQEVIVVRPFTGYGAGQDVSYPFPRIIQDVQNEVNPLVLWGTGNQVRDFIHIDDIVEAVITMLSHDLTGPVNLGTGVPTTIADFARQVCLETDHRPLFKALPERPTGVQFRCADTSLLRTFYKPQVSLQEGIQRALGGA